MRKSFLFIFILTGIVHAQVAWSAPGEQEQCPQGQSGTGLIADAADQMDQMALNVFIPAIDDEELAEDFFARIDKGFDKGLCENQAIDRARSKTSYWQRFKLRRAVRRVVKQLIERAGDGTPAAAEVRCFGNAFGGWLSQERYEPRLVECLRPIRNGTR